MHKTFEDYNKEVITINDVDLIDIDTTLLKHFSERENDVIDLIDQIDTYPNWESYY